MGLTSLHLGTPISAGTNFTVHFSYTARLATSGLQQGLQRSAPFSVPSTEPQRVQPGEDSAAQQQQQQQVLIATSTEPFGARSIMPCFDAPHYKASIAITIEAPANLTALCNMEAVSVNMTAKAGIQVVTCAASPPMPTYMMAVTVGSLAGRTGMSNSGLSITTWSVPGLEGQLRTALQVWYYHIPILVCHLAAACKL